MQTYKMICYHESVINKLYPHQDMFFIDAESIVEAESIFHEKYKEYVLVAAILVKED